MGKAVWTLEGELDGRLVRWSSAPMPGFDPVLLEPPGTFRYGLGDTVGVSERLSVAVNVANDGTFDDLAIGRSVDDVDWEGPSLRGLKCRLFRYTGPASRLALTPPLVVADLQVDVGAIALNLLADEHEILGPSAALHTVEEWRQAGVVLEDADPFAATSLGVTVSELAGVFTSAIQQGMHTQIPWLYGSAAVKLEAVSDDAVWRIAGIVDEAHAAAVMAGEYWGYYNFYAKAGGGPLLHTHKAYPVIFRSAGGLPGRLLAWYVTAPPEVEILHVFDARPISPMEVIRRILDDHAAKPMPYDAASAAAAELATVRLDQVVGGAYAAAATVEEVLGAIAPICGVEAYLHLDGRLHFATLPSAEDSVVPVVELDAYDVFPTGPDRIPGATAALPASPPEFGALAGTISIDWPDYLAAAHPIATGTDHRRVSDAEGEVRLEGAWVYPPRASVALSAAMGWFGAPIRTVSIPTHITVLEGVNPGDVVAFRAPGLPGDRRRIGVVRHMEVRPADELVMVAVGDLGWEGMVREGVLDSFENWVLFAPLQGTPIGIDPGSHGIWVGAEVFAEEDVGRAIWIRGSAYPENNRSYRIVHVLDPTHVQIEPNPEIPDEWEEDGSRSLLLLRVAYHELDAEVVDGKIAVADEPRFPDGNRAYRFSR